MITYMHLEELVNISERSTLTTNNIINPASKQLKNTPQKMTLRCIAKSTYIYSQYIHKQMCIHEYIIRSRIWIYLGV